LFFCLEHVFKNVINKCDFSIFLHVVYGDDVMSFTRPVALSVGLSVSFYYIVSRDVFAAG